MKTKLLRNRSQDLYPFLESEFVRVFEMNSGARDAAQTGHKRQATKTGRHVVTQGSLGDGGVLRRRGEPELGRNLFRRRELQRD